MNSLNKNNNFEIVQEKEYLRKLLQKQLVAWPEALANDNYRRKRILLHNFSCQYFRVMSDTSSESFHHDFISQDKILRT